VHSCISKDANLAPVEACTPIRWFPGEISGSKIYKNWNLTFIEYLLIGWFCGAAMVLIVWNLFCCQCEEGHAKLNQAMRLTVRCLVFDIYSA
jgi:hypothetical protein